MDFLIFALCFWLLMGLVFRLINTRRRRKAQQARSSYIAADGAGSSRDDAQDDRNWFQRLMNEPTQAEGGGGIFDGFGDGGDGDGGGGD